MKNSENILSSWLPKREEISSGDPSLESKKNASTWLGVETLPIENSTPTSPSPSQEKASIWLGGNPPEEKPATTNLNPTSFSRENALAWLGVESLEKKTPTSPSLGNASTWLGVDPLKNSTPTSPSSSQEKASIWLGVELTPLQPEEKPTINISTSLLLEERPRISVSQPIPPQERPQITTKIATKPDFSQTIIRVFSNEPHRAVPPIQNQRNGQSMLDFLGRGFAIQGPANHSQPSISHRQKPSVNQKSLLEFMTNPFSSPSSTIVAPNVTKPNKIERIYC